MTLCLKCCLSPASLLVCVFQSIYSKWKTKVINERSPWGGVTYRICDSGFAAECIVSCELAFPLSLDFSRVVLTNKSHMDTVVQSCRRTNISTLFNCFISLPCFGGRCLEGPVLLCASELIY